MFIMVWFKVFVFYSFNFFLLCEIDALHIDNLQNNMFVKHFEF